MGQKVKFSELSPNSNYKKCLEKTVKILTLKLSFITDKSQNFEIIKLNFLNDNVKNIQQLFKIFTIKLNI